MIRNFFLIELNNLTSTSRGTILLSVEKFAAMKLTGQASQYWTNLVNMRTTREQEPIDTWRRMKDELKGKYVPPPVSARLMDKWHWYTQGNKSAKEYVEKFDEFFIRCNTLSTEGQSQSCLGLEPNLGKTYELNF